MKIQGPNHSNFNPYKNQLQPYQRSKASSKNADQLQISSQAKKMLEKGQSNAERTAHVEEIREAVNSGNYKIDFKKTAGKMADFWTKPR